TSRQVFKPTRFRQCHHRSRVGVDHLFRSISSTASGLSYGARGSPPPEDQEPAVKNERLNQLGKDISGSNVNPKLSDAMHEKQFNKDQWKDREIKILAEYMDTKIAKLSETVKNCEKKVDTTCGNLREKMNADRKAAHEASMLLYYLFRHDMSDKGFGYPVGGGKQQMPPPTSSSCATGDKSQ
ncbi:hypothetical protein HOY82DRAFT_145954, partial [Tuber indicum]